MKLFAYVNGEKTYFAHYSPDKIKTRADVVRAWGRRFSKGKIPHTFTPDDLFAEPDEPAHIIHIAIFYGSIGGVFGFHWSWLHAIGYCAGAIVTGFFISYRSYKKDVEASEKFNQSITPSL